MYVQLRAQYEAQCEEADRLWQIASPTNRVGFKYDPTNPDHVAVSEAQIKQFDLREKVVAAWLSEYSA